MGWDTKLGSHRRDHRRDHQARNRGAFIDQLEKRVLFSNSYPYPNAVDNDVAYASNTGNVYAAWFEMASGGGGVLKVSKRSSSGWTDLGAVPLPSGITSSDYGEYVSLAVDSTGNPAVAFADTTNGDLDFARYTATGWANATQIESTASIYPSLQFQSGNTWGVSYYYNTTHKDLRLATIDVSSGTVNKSDLDTSGDVGRSSSLGIDPNTDKFDVSYEYTDPTGVASQVRYRSQDSSGNWSTQIIDADTDQGGGYISMNFDPTNGNRPAVSYYIAAVTGSTRYGLMFARQNSTGTWDNDAVVRQSKSIYTSLIWDSGSHRFNIVYDDDSTGTVSRFFGNYGNWGTRRVVYTGGGRFVHAAATVNQHFVSTFVEAGQNYMYVNDTQQMLGVNDLTQGTPAFPARTHAGNLTFNNKIYVLGGDDSTGNPTNAVLTSTNGTSWNTVSTSGVFSARDSSGAIVATVGGQQRMYVIGGHTASALANDVWYTTDGINWTEATAGQDPNSRFTPRQNMGVLYYNSKLWVIAGADSHGGTNDVWSSSDGGATWTNATASSTSQFPVRESMPVYVQPNQSTPRMYVVGGYDPHGTGTVLPDVWSSVDGTNWTEETTAATFYPREGATGVFAEGKMWLIGGTEQNIYFSDVWWSIDGKSWINTGATTQAGRAYSGVGVLGNKMYIFGGDGTFNSILSEVCMGSLD